MKLLNTYGMGNTKEIKIKGIAHITGGAFTKLRRLNKNVGFLLDNMPKPHNIFNEIWNHVDDEKEMYKTFNMGIGMVVIVSNKYADDAMNTLSKYVKTKRIGRVVRKPGVFIRDTSNPLTL